MDFGAWFKAVTEIGQSTNGGFTVIALIASVSCWLLYRGTLRRLTTLEADLKSCNDKHVEGDRRLNSVSISTAALWTIINMSGDRRGYQLPPLDEVLAGRMVIQVRAGSPEGDRRAVTPLVTFDSPDASG